jgi:hypothetical protein
MEGQREKTSSRRRQRRKSKASRSKVVVEPVLIAARRPDSPLLKTGFHMAVASAQPKQSGMFGGHATNGHNGSNGSADPQAHPATNGHAASNGSTVLNADNGARSGVAAESEDTSSAEAPRGEVARRRAVRIVKLADHALSPGNREQQLLDRLVRSQGRGAISRAADDLWECKFVAPKQQEVQIQLLEHENEQKARDAVFIMAELLQKEAPIKRPVLDQRLRRLEQSAEDPITRDAAGALRRSMRVHHGA